MKKTFILMVVILTVGMLFLFTQRDRGLAQGNDAKIADAVRAAPPSIAKDATIMDLVPPGANPVVLRQGTNGWTCFPSDPTRPTKNPMCLDKTWMEWVRAYMTQTKPNITSVGISYMLQGGCETKDPYAPPPASKDQWICYPPHIMILQPGKWDPTLYATEAEYNTKPGPWLMWAGTPYEILIVPVADPAD